MGVSLQKGDRVSLAKQAEDLTTIRVGLGWDQAGTGFLDRLLGRHRAIDLDASCVLLDAQGRAVDAAWWRNLRPHKAGVHHLGDNLTGSGDGDDESILVRLGDVPDRVQALVFTITSYTGQAFGGVRNAYCRVVDQGGGRELARYDLGATGPHTGMIVARIERDGRGWRIVAVGEPAYGATWQDVV